MAERQARRGTSVSETREYGPAALRVARYDWETSQDFSGGDLVLDDGRHVVAADACIYYRDELRERLATQGVKPAGESASHLILAAYTAWGQRCAEYLDGAFAFIVYDRQSGDVLIARDMLGTRPLYFAQVGETLIVASTVAAILEFPGCAQSINLANIGATAAGWLSCNGSDTSYDAVDVVPMATCIKRSGTGLESWRYWSPPELDDSQATSFEEGAEELRELLARAVWERLAHDAPTAVSMSGGRDSTAVFATGQYAIRKRNSSRSLFPVSISYPVGDPGREDHFIRAIADRWESPIQWLDINDIPMFERDEERASTRDEPSTSPYENWNVALGKGARAIGARVILDGNGGDQLFRVTDIYLADLLQRGRLVSLASELWAKRSRGWNHLWQLTVPPVLPDPLFDLVNKLKRGHRMTHYMAFPRPSWIRRDFARAHNLEERMLSSLPKRHAEHHEAAALQWFFTCPTAGYSFTILQQRLLEAGVDPRGPLTDRRIIEFAFRRPRSERLQGLDEKRLLRASMRGLIPDDVLAPRDARTGITISYSRSSMLERMPPLCEAMFQKPLRLAELGVIDPHEFRRLVAKISDGRVGEFARISAFHTFQTEMWLRARLH